MTLKEAEALALRLMEEHGVGPNQGWQFHFNKRRKALGLCDYTKKWILLSTHYTLASTEEEVRQVILHEIAHALTPDHGHDRVWLWKARSIGYTGYRLIKLSDEQRNAKKRIASYRAVCVNGHEHFYFRVPKRKKSCGKCCDRFNPDFLLTFERIPTNKKLPLAA